MEFLCKAFFSSHFHSVRPPLLILGLLAMYRTCPWNLLNMYDNFDPLRHQERCINVGQLQGRADYE